MPQIRSHPNFKKKKMKKQKELGKWLCGQNASCAHKRVPNTQVRTGMKTQVSNPSAGETHPGGFWEYWLTSLNQMATVSLAGTRGFRLTEIPSLQN